MSPEVQCPDQAAALRLGFVASSDPGLRGVPDTAGTDGPYVACETHAAGEQPGHASASLGMASLPRYISQDGADLQYAGVHDGE